MKKLFHSILLLMAFGLLLGQLVGCKEKPPDVAGKWSGNSNLTAQVSTRPGSTQLQQSKPVPVQIILTLNQNGSGFTGDASITINGKPPVHLPITAGVVDQSGKVSFEADRSGFSSVHLSFTGKLATGQLSGDLALKMDTFAGVAENAGSVTLSRIG